MNRISLLPAVGIVVIFTLNMSCREHEPRPVEPETLTVAYDERATVVDGEYDVCELISGTTIKSVARILPDGLSTAHIVYLVEVVSAPFADKFSDSHNLCHTGQKLAISRSDMNRMYAMSYAIKKFSKTK